MMCVVRLPHVTPLQVTDPASELVSNAEPCVSVARTLWPQSTYVPDDVRDRLSTHAADMFRSEWPTGHQVHFLSNIFHDWDRARNLRLAKASFAALPSGGRIVLHEMMMKDGMDATPLMVACFSVHMLTYLPGRQYTFEELSGVLAEAGFEGVKSVPSHPYYALVIGAKP